MQKNYPRNTYCSFLCSLVWIPVDSCHSCGPFLWIPVHSYGFLPFLWIPVGISGGIKSTAPEVYLEASDSIWNGRV